MPKDSFDQCWLIAGPPRAGKTLIAEMLAGIESDYFVLPVEGLFPRILRHNLPSIAPADALKTYLYRPRYTSPEKQKKVYPAQYFSSDIDSIVNDVPSGSLISMIGCAYQIEAKKEVSQDGLLLILV